MPTKSELLDEYCKIHDDLNKLRDRIELVKQETQIKLYFCKNNREKNEVLLYHKKQLNNIKNNKKIKENYKLLKNKQDQIKIILIDDNKNYPLSKTQNLNKNIFEKNNKHKIITKEISGLLCKYKKYSSESS